MKKKKDFDLRWNDGAARITPSDDVIAGSRGTWTIHYKVGSYGVKVGGGLKIVPPQKRMARWEVGKVTVTCSRPGVGFDVELVNCHPVSWHHSQFPVIKIRVHGRDLKKGDVISTTIGDPGGYVSGFWTRARAQEFARNGMEWEVYVDAMGNANYANRNYPFKGADMYLPIRKFPEMNVIPGPARKLVIAPTATPMPGEKARLTIHALDEFDNVAEGYGGRISFYSSDPKATLPKEYTFRKSDRGRHTFACVFRTRGVQKVTAVDVEGGVVGNSAPILVGGFGHRYNVYVGEIHHKTAQSDGLGTHDDSYRFARDVMGLDFSAVSDHEGGKDWSAAQTGAEKYNAPGRFVTLLGYEYSRGKEMGCSHRNVYFLDGNEERQVPEDPDQLVPLLRGKKAIVICHHPNIHSEGGPLPARWSWRDWDRYYDEEYERLVEMCQIRGSFETEKPGGPVIFGGFGGSVQTALKKGRKLGFIGGTDNHHGHPASYRSPMAGLDWREMKKGGLACVLAKELTREAIFEAMRNRRTFATSGERMLVDFRINGHLMGEEIEVKGGPIRITGRAIGTTDLVAVEIIKDNKVFKAVKPRHRRGKEARFTLTDRPSVGRTHWYYLRVTQQQMHQAWSSPIWVMARE